MMQATVFTRYTVTSEGVIWYDETRLYSHEQVRVHMYKREDDHGERHVYLTTALYNLYLYPDFDQSMEIDHKDENRANNSILNLEASTKEAHWKKTRQLEIVEKIRQVKGGKIQNEQ
jgi:hypothetical protein